MSFIVHLSYLWVFFHSSSHWIKYILGTLTSYSRHSEGITVWIFNFLWPVIISLVRHAKWFLQLRSILALLNLIEFVSQPSHVLSLNHSIYVVGAISFLSIGIVLRHLGSIIKETRVHLLNPWLVLSALPVPPDMLGGPRDINQVLVVFNGSLGGIITNL